MRAGIRRADIGVMLGCVLLAGGLLAGYVQTASGSARQVEITVDGRPYAVYPLNEIKSTKAVEIQTEFGYNRVEITQEGARVTDADCPDKLDVRAGWITKPGQSLICLPNRLVVQLTGADSVDGVAY